MIESDKSMALSPRTWLWLLALRFAVWTNAHWKKLTVLLWLGIAIYYFLLRWDAIYYFALGDTDDNVRYVQVKDWLAGQGWYDLTQHRFDPPRGGNIHWSRFVDLPIAGLILFFHLFLPGAMADRVATGIAPLLPLLLLMLSLGFITRRLVNNHAWIVAVLAPLAAAMGIGMFMPLRIDHHGWQLALLATTLAGLVDRNWIRGGIVAGLSTALSIAIGMEMIVYLAAGGGLIALRWVFKEGAARRMRPYAVSLALGMSVFYLIFASDANRQPVCDAISPIWVTIMMLVSAGMLLLSFLPDRVAGLSGWPLRLAAGAVVGGVIGLVAWHNWPQCLTGAYGTIPPELQRLWLANIREAKPLQSQSWNSIVPMVAMPVLGVIGAVAACWWVRRDTDRLWAWATVALMTIFAFALLFWQIRAAPAAQLLAIPAASWLAYGAVRAILLGRRSVKLAGAAGLLAVTGVFWAYEINDWVGHLGAPAPAPAARRKPDLVQQANARCRTEPALSALNTLPPATIFTMVDLGPRIIATTHHSVLAGPYHRNSVAILDIHHAFDGPADGFRGIAARHHAAYLLICRYFPEGTIYQSRSPQGFYAQMMRGQVPGWLALVNLPVQAELPYQLYRIDYGASAPGGKKGA